MPDTVYIAIHHHRHGVDVFPFRCSSKPPSEVYSWDKDELATALGIDFESEREDEYLDVVSATVPTIP